MQDTEFRDRAFAYTREHAERLPVVVAAREGRSWGLFRPLQQATFEQDWGRQPTGVYWAGLWFYWALLPFAVGASRACALLGLLAGRCCRS